ncbi:MAG TPA: FtsX-like permease family protein [Xanthobacteraceae bacterium]|nr:FtsX-like permease family protein [Xanthobacteraceae bacterium]
MMRLALRYAWRDLRGGMRGFGVFIACIALGVMAISGVGSVSASLADGMAAAGQAILGGDLSFSLIQRQASDAERKFFDAHGTVSVTASVRAMARSDDGQLTLVELKAVDDAYPLFGTVGTDPNLPLRDLLAQRDGAFGAAVDPALLTRLNLKTGDRISIGSAVIVVRAALINEPDRLSGGIGFGPRVLVSAAALRATGLLQPGSLVQWQYRLRLPANQASDADVAAVENEAQSALPDAGWQIGTRDKASPRLERSVDRFSEFLTLVALTTLMVGGVGVANAVAAHLARKRDSIATMKALGATGGGIFAIYCTEIVLVGLLAAVVGAGLGAGLPFAVWHWLGAVIPLPVTPSLHPAVLALSIAYGVLTALVFALWPLGRAHDISAAMLFRDQVAPERRWPRQRYVIGTVLVVAAFVALAIVTTSERRIAAIFIASAVAIFLMLRLVALLAMWIAKHLPRWRSATLRLALANIHRPGALTPTVMLSLGLGLALLTTVIEIDGNLHREFTAALPGKAPSFFFIDVPAVDAAHFDAFVRAQAPDSHLERVPMLRGRIVEANGIKADDLKPAAGSRWVLRGDRGITYSSTVPAGSRVVDGRWWSTDYSGEPLVSVESKSAHDLGLKVGETITVNVLGRNVTARIANLRAVDWENLGINFVLVFSPGAFAGAPHSDIATLTFADGGTAAEEATLVKALANTFPTVTAIGVKDALNTLNTVVSNIILALRGASSLTLLAAALVLGGGLAASQRFRIYDAVVLKTLGATRVRLLAAYAIEYALIGLATVLFGVAMGSLAAGVIVTQVMEFLFTFLPAQAAAAAFSALFVTLVIGLAGTFAALGRKPSEVLRNL